MYRNDVPIECARMVPPRALRGYAEGMGWQRVEGVNGKIAVYRNPDTPLRQIIVPLDEHFDDYGERTAEAIERLAEFERCPARQVLNHLLLPPSDVILLREVSLDAENGNLPLDHGIRLVDGTRKALLSVAHSVLVPQPYHPRMSRGEAEQFVSRCRLGPAEAGSFVITVACPLDLQAGLFGLDGKPFTRRVTSLFLQTLEELSQAAEDPGADLADPVQHPGISANFCESLLMIRPSGERANVSVCVTWSKALLPKAREFRRDIQLRQEVFDLAEGLAPRLRSLPTPRIDRFIGFVDELRGQPTPHDPRPSGEVRFTLFDQDEEIHAKANLTASEYAEAGAAHLGSYPVTFKGILYRLPRLNRIDQVTDFKLVRFDEDELPQQKASH